jgi:haloalkane dehalogenase
MAEISAQDPYERQYVPVMDTDMAYVDVGSGDPVVFLHGNPTSSYLWRNIIPHCEPLARCLAPDLIGMGQSGKHPAGEYRFVDHYRYLNGWFNTVGATDNVILVIHDWGSGLGFHWANQHRDRVQGIVYMESILMPMAFSQWPEAAQGIFQAMRSEKGDELIYERNFFVERILPNSVLRDLSDAEMAVYRRPYEADPQSRKPTLIWPREIPFDGQPADVHQIVADYSAWLKTSDDLPKLFINAEPGVILTGAMRDFARSLPNQQEITVKGSHFIQEDSPHEIGQAVAGFIQQIRA